MARKNNNVNEEPATTENVEAQPTNEPAKIRPIESYHASVQALHDEATIMFNEPEYDGDRHIQMVIWNTTDVLKCDDLEKIKTIYDSCMNQVNWLNNPRLNAHKRSRGQKKAYTATQQVVVDANNILATQLLNFVVDGLASLENPQTLDCLKRSGVRETTEQQNHNDKTMLAHFLSMVEGANPIPKEDSV
tara:strand:- start:122 stop:691 length:570 start_codon:yes stop_codon:yes gene_type:complete